MATIVLVSTIMAGMVVRPTAPASAMIMVVAAGHLTARTLEMTAGGMVARATAPRLTITDGMAVAPMVEVVATMVVPATPQAGMAAVVTVVVETTVDQAAITSWLT